VAATKYATGERRNTVITKTGRLDQEFVARRGTNPIEPMNGTREREMGPVPLLVVHDCRTSNSMNC
jgi:hypothetical protein